MARGQDFSANQKKIIDRYYEHRDTIMSHKLGELVSDLYLAETDKKRAALWLRIDKALANLPPTAAWEKKRAVEIIEQQDLKGLAELVNKLAGR